MHLEERQNHRRNLILKARQHGITTFYAIDLLDEAIWIPGTSCAILSHERQANSKIFQIVKRAYENLPREIKPVAKYDTKTSLSFAYRCDGLQLDSSIYVDLKLRGGTVQKLHITESAYIKDRNELNAGSKQAVPKEGWITEETTANGFNEFFDFYTDADENPNPKELEYKTYFYGWHLNPEYSLITDSLNDKTVTENELCNKYALTDGQIAWRRWKIKELFKEGGGFGLTGEQIFKQEYPISKSEAFQSGVGNVFNAEKLDSITPLPTVITGNELSKRGFVFWKDREEGKDYLIGVDPSDGQGSDFSVIDVWEKETLIQCAQFHGKVRPDELAEITKEAAEYFNKAFVGVENNMLTTILLLSKIYDNYFFTTRIDEKTAKRTKKLGWNTNTKTRDVMIDDFIQAFEEDSLTINSPITIREAKSFVKKDNGKREHADGKFDDALFAGFIALQMRKHWKPSPRVFQRKPAGF